MPIIPKEQSADFPRWNASAFDEKRKPPPAPPPATAPAPSVVTDAAGDTPAEFRLPTAEEIERMQNDAQAEGYRAGFESGHQEGFRQGEAAALAEARRLDLLCANLAGPLATLDQQVADQVLELAVEVARQVLRSTLTVEPERILPVIREAVASLPLHHGNLALHVHPDDAALLHRLLGNQIGQSGWHLIEDASVTSGGCLLRAGTSEVDATLQTRWKRVLEAIGHPPGADGPGRPEMNASPPPGRMSQRDRRETDE